jgi:hypothetical protein
MLSLVATGKKLGSRGFWTGARLAPEGSPAATLTQAGTGE